MTRYFSLLSVFFVLLFSCTSTQLPILGPTDIVQTPFDDYKVGDTLYHTLPYFEMINQKGDTVSSLDYRHKIHIANFFFATCPEVCPIMMQRMNTLAQKFTNQPIYFVSFTVNPTRDTPAVLLQYAQDQRLTMQNWQLLTGEKEEIYALAGRQGYLLNVGEDALAPGGFFHSVQAVLVDGDFKIRGIYDTTNEKELQQLEKDAEKLLKQTLHL